MKLTKASALDTNPRRPLLHRTPVISADRPGARRRRDFSDPESNVLEFDIDSDTDDESMNEFHDEFLDSYASMLGFSGSDGLDEARSLAALRRVLGKRVPSKEFMGSLEVVNAEELPEEDRSKWHHCANVPDID